MNISSTGLCPYLVRWVWDQREADPGRKLGVQKGRSWAGPKLGPQSLGACGALSEVAEMVLPAEQFSWEAWGTVLYPGGSIGWHCHEQAEWAAVCWPEGSKTPLRFRDRYFFPLPGDLLMFSGMAEHCVSCHTGEAPRVSVAWNFFSLNAGGHRMPSWVTPSVKPAGTLITEAIWTQDVVYNPQYLKGQLGTVELEDALYIEEETSGTNAVVFALTVHVKSTGAMSDGFGPGIYFVAEDSGAVENAAGGIHCRRNGADDGYDLVFGRGKTGQGLVTGMYLDTDGGLVVGGPTGASQGTGTVNAQAVYDDGALLTDYVFDRYFDGEVAPADRAWAGSFRMVPLKALRARLARDRSLPSMPDRAEWRAVKNRSLGRLISGLWEAVECQALYIIELKAELDALRVAPGGIESRTIRPVAANTAGSYR